ncbi:hypothetical protein TIFTF001_045008 [Ficus carica]|uniref:Uncharacterized protein n=1 Tax=Ficus carica TaxID=3494 RepID=A0AA87ZLI4_FICCA|nr:hypothetical protein TIFTF001_044996 [Ficus carica]GMN35362.1 hypothetical protein TIFTF001_045008 [Ficus carica]
MNLADERRNTTPNVDSNPKTFKTQACLSLDPLPSKIRTKTSDIDKRHTKTLKNLDDKFGC